MLSLYVHIPFCVKKCLYCGFYSTQYTPALSDAYLSALEVEAASYQEAFAGREFDTVYLGGGTPTTLTSAQFERLCTILRDHFSLSASAEITTEANPNTLDVHALDCMRANGVNRLSIGVQSFSDDVLRTLGRSHTAGQAQDAVKLARKAGFTNIGLDLIYGVPGQTFEQVTQTLRKAMELGPQHLSAYGLSLDRGSFFSQEAEAGRLCLPDDDVVAPMYERIVSTLTAAGYGHYEISNFSRPGHECRHNLNYWERGEYLGLGPAAWSFISGKRYGNVSPVDEYCDRLRKGISPIADTENIDALQSAAETVLLGLRTERGVDLGRFEREHGSLALASVTKNIDVLRDNGLITLSAGRVQLTDRGKLLADKVIERLVT
jgi:oxygen-independent coproporphyrinogen III oxidase